MIRIRLEYQSKETSEVCYLAAPPRVGEMILATNKKTPSKVQSVTHVAARNVGEEPLIIVRVA